jgi:cytochrome c biogenesis protein CcdA
MLLKNFLTRKGWRVLAHGLLATAGISLLYFLYGMVMDNIMHQTLSWWTLALPIAVSIWLVVLGSMLVRAELKNWR